MIVGSNSVDVTKPEGFIDQKKVIKNHKVIIDGKNFYYQSIDSDIKRYEEIRKLTAGQGKDYSIGNLLDYD